jgi:hypothetical protein
MPMMAEGSIAEKVRGDQHDDHPADPDRASAESPAAAEAPAGAAHVLNIVAFALVS